MLEIIRNVAEYYYQTLFGVVVCGFVFCHLAILVLGNRFKMKSTYDKLSKQVFRVCTSLYFLSFLFLFYSSYIAARTDSLSWARLFGAYWYTFWMYPIIFALMYALSFSKKLLANIFLLLLGFLAICPLGKLMILMSSHRDYLPSSSNNLLGNYISFAIETIVYAFICTSVYVLFMILLKAVKRT
jgi:hypothetical protein